MVVAYQAHLPALMQAAEAAGFCANVAWLVHEPLTSILDEFTTACLAGALAYQWPAEYANGTNLAGNESAAREPTAPSERRFEPGPDVHECYTIDFRFC